MTPQLFSLYIYLTDQCNLNCIHCWQSAPLAGNENYSSLNFDESQAFLDDTISMGLKNITFSGGEPLLNRDFHKFAEYFDRNSIHMTMETNGLLITNPVILETIKKYNIYCAISLDGITPEIHNKHRGLATAHQQTLKSIEKLEDEGIHYQLIMALSWFNYNELQPLLDWVTENCKYCDNFKINIVSNLGRAMEMKDKGLLFKAEELPAISEKIASLFEKYPFLSLHVDPVFVSFKHLMLKFSCGGYCGYQSSLSILANGNISICSLGKQVDEYIFGHIATIDVKDLWTNHPMLVDIHENMHKKLKGICSNCIFRKQCQGGCRAAALCAYDDFFAPHPQCQSYYESGEFPEKKLIDAKKEMGGNFRL